MTARRARLAARSTLVATLVATVAATGLAGCASGPAVPDWQLGARGALDQAVAADLRGDSRIANLEFDRARSEIARTGRPDLLARAALLRCAADTASLQLGPCEAFEALRMDAAPAERAYADHLAGRLVPTQAALLPPAQQPVAALAAGKGPVAGPAAGTAPAPAPAMAMAMAGDDSTAAATLQGLADPLSRLVGAAVLLRAGQAGPGVIRVAVDTASAQGWRRPLLAWLGLQHQLAVRAGAAEVAAALQRRIDLVGGGGR